MNERIFIQANAPSGKIFDPKLDIFKNHENIDFLKIPKVTKNKKLLELERIGKDSQFQILCCFRCIYHFCPDLEISPKATFRSLDGNGHFLMDSTIV